MGDSEKKPPDGKEAVAPEPRSTGDTAAANGGAAAEKETPSQNGGAQKPASKKAPPPVKKSKKDEPPAPKYVVSPGPHLRTEESVPGIMYAVVLALLPAGAVGVYAFGPHALWVIVTCVLSAVIAEAVVQKLFGRPVTALDGSAVLTGLLLAYSIPAGLPLYMVAVGGALAVIIAKQLFGGLGYNIFNPAMIGRAILLLSWPAAMTHWFAPHVDAVTAATPLALLKGHEALPPLRELFLGLNIGGSLGETSSLALLAGAAFLLWRRVITWHVPTAVLGVVAILALVTGQNPAEHLFSGGLILGAFFIATDMVTMPISNRGRLIFGAGIGALVFLVRHVGGYPEGVCYAVLLMNSVTPLIDRYVRPRKFGG